MNNTNSLLKNIWAEKYRPQKIEDCLLPESLKNKFLKMDRVNHFLFWGDTGVGKTSVAKILAEKFAPQDYIYINAAEENGIDTIRTKITNFISHKSFLADYKIIIFDEASALTTSAQEALRSIMETHADSCRFIMTCNDLGQISKAILSRLQLIEFTPPSKKDLAPLLWKIAQKENITFKDSDKEGFRTLINRYYPDIRKCLNELEKCCLTGSFVWEERDDFFNELWNKIQTKVPPLTIRAWILKEFNINSINFNNIYRFLFDKFPENEAAILLINKYMNLQKNVVDREINFTAFLIELSRI